MPTYRYAMSVTAADVGRRVVVRRRLGTVDGVDSFGDLLGHLLAFGDEQWTVRRRDGEVVTVRPADVVAAKVVPEAPPRRDRRDGPAAGAEPRP